MEMPVNKSDVIRLHLLSKHGGVWTDATMVCMRPLDDWLQDMINSSRVWMYHGRENCNLLASWFIVAKKHSYMMNAWKDKCDEFWSKIKTDDVDYFFMDTLWKEVYESDNKFREEWSKVSSICCEDEGQAHMLNGHVNGKEPHLQKIISENPPHIIKLNHREYIEDDPDTNSNIAFKKSLGE
jgi:hypothetical protein